MRYFLVAALVLFGAGAVSAFPSANHYATLSAIIDSPQGQMLLAVGDLSQNVAPEDAPFMEYLSFFAWPGDRPTARRAFRAWFNHLQASKQSIVREVEVDGPNGSYLKTATPCSLIRIDIRKAPNWTRTAWNLVADRDYLFRERPFGTLTNREATFGRIITGHAVNEKTLAAGFILNAYQLFRDGLDTTRSQTHYDLLYAHRRHPDADGGNPTFQVVPRVEGIGPKPTEPAGIPWPGGVWPNDGKYYAPGAFVWVKREQKEAYEKDLAAWNKAQADKPLAAGPKRSADVIPTAFISVKDANKGIAGFPLTGKDFEVEWDAFIDPKDIRKKLLIDPRMGGIAPGADSDQKVGSIVAGQDRVISILNTRWGWASRTFDVKKNVGDKDHIERFREVALGDAKADAHELLASIPNGAQAALLSDADDKRLEVAITEIARNLDRKVDGRFVDVRTHQGCIACHAPNGGFNEFVDQFQASRKAGINFNVADPKDAQAVEDFYLAWQKQVKRWKDPYTVYIEETTLGPDGKSWTGQEMWKQFERARDMYDLPVNLEMAAWEFGIPAPLIRQKVFGRTQTEGAPEVRLNQLATDRGIPRVTWQDEVAGKLAFRLDAVAPRDEEAIKRLLKPQLLEDAARKFGVKLLEK